MTPLYTEANEENEENEEEEDGCRKIGRISSYARERSYCRARQWNLFSVSFVSFCKTVLCIRYSTKLTS